MKFVKYQIVPKPAPVNNNGGRVLPRKNGRVKASLFQGEDETRRDGLKPVAR